MSQAIESNTTQDAALKLAEYVPSSSQRIKEAHLLGSTSAILGWDQEVMMPEARPSTSYSIK